MIGDPLLWIFTLTLLSLAPFLIITLTCFARVSIVLMFVRHGLGVGNTPPNVVLHGIALLLSAMIMSPVGEAMYERAQALCITDGQWRTPSWEDAQSIAEPWAAFVEMNIGEAERNVATQLRWMHRDPTQSPEDDPLVLATAFMLTELGRAIKAGVFILLPFLMIDLLTGLVLLALGMHMLSPTSVTPALKLLFFVSVEGWLNIAIGLRDGYNLPVLSPL